MNITDAVFCRKFALGLFAVTSLLASSCSFKDTDVTIAEILDQASKHVAVGKRLEVITADLESDGFACYGITDGSKSDYPNVIRTTSCNKKFNTNAVFEVVVISIVMSSDKNNTVVHFAPNTQRTSL